MIFFRLWAAWTLFVFVVMNVIYSALQASQGNKNAFGWGAVVRTFVMGLAAAGWWYLLWK